MEFTLKAFQVQCIDSDNSETGNGGVGGVCEGGVCGLDHFLERVKTFIPERAGTMYGEGTNAYTFRTTQPRTLRQNLYLFKPSAKHMIYHSGKLHNKKHFLAY